MVWYIKRKGIFTMKSALFITSSIITAEYGGSVRTLQNIKSISNEMSCDIYRIENTKHSFFDNCIKIIKSLYGLNYRNYREILEKLKENNKYQFVCFDGPIYGVLCKKIKKLYPSIRLIVFYHNFDLKYYKDEHRFDTGIKMIKSKIAEFFLYKNEKMSTVVSDYKVFISENDKKEVLEYYGVNNINSVVMPPCIDDKFPDRNFIEKRDIKEYGIFLGSAFFANIEAGKFIIEKIAPYVYYKMIIVGKGMKTAFPDSYENVEVYDYVEDLSELMCNALFFVSPIFSGSGSKIKIAEALMYGKYVIGTEESFHGYNIEDIDISICETSDDFIKSINSLKLDGRFCNRNRKYFLNNHLIANTSIRKYLSNL